MTTTELLKYREFHWNYFSLHADQRLKMFNFYLIFSAILIGAFINILDEAKSSVLTCVLPYLLAIISFVFWKVELRIKYMIKNSEEAMKQIDDQLIKNESENPSVLNTFRYDDFISQSRKKGVLKGHLSYSKGFNIIFLLFGFFGLVVGSYYLLHRIIC